MKEQVEIRELQLKELEILKEFIRVCNILNLKYFLGNGTLIGCIRHQGFIPWDDDIDVNMPREDYDKFMQEGQKILKSEYFLQNYKTDKEYTQAFAKIRNSETTFIESTVKELNINHGVYIDIFPLDGYNPKEKIINMLNEKRIALYNVKIAKIYSIYKEPNTMKQKLIERISNTIYNKTSTNQLLEKEEKIARRHEYNKSEYVCCHSWNPAPSKLYMPKEYFGKGVIKEFEGIKVKVPENYDAYLKRIYGNYMELPPEEKRIAHHYNEIIDLNKSYKEYIKK